uniref:Histone 1.B n=1 Tax=Phacoides pectinatus TaxID=244486 RepID=A0A3G4ZKV7_PHAPT|nr:histone 1.B [Phacoides pectinatus]
MSAAPVKAKKAAKPKKPSTHPKYSEMIAKAITSLKERGGSSRQAILKHIMANFNVGKDAAAVNAHLKMALKRGVAKGALKQSKGTGASGSFRLGEKKAAPKKVVKAKKPKSPKKKAAKKPAAAGEKKPKAKKAAKPKKAKSPKKAAKPKKAKTPKKAGAKASKPKTKKKSPKKAKAARK